MWAIVGIMISAFLVGFLVMNALVPKDSGRDSWPRHRRGGGDWGEVDQRADDEDLS